MENDTKLGGFQWRGELRDGKWATIHRKEKDRRNKSASIGEVNLAWGVARGIYEWAGHIITFQKQKANDLKSRRFKKSLHVWGSPLTIKAVKKEPEGFEVPKRKVSFKCREQPTEQQTNERRG